MEVISEISPARFGPMQTCPDGYHSLRVLVPPALARFAEWMESYLDGEADIDNLVRLEEVYKFDNCRGDNL
jgi:hypothetical protein